LKSSIVICYNINKRTYLLTHYLICTDRCCICRYPRRPWLRMDSLVEFGVMVKGCRVISRQIFIHNDGSLRGDFHFNYAGNLPLTVSPWSGHVPPNSSKIIKVIFDVYFTDE